MLKPIYLFSISSHPHAININSLSIIFLKPYIDFSHYDYLIITSKQASQALKQYEKKQYIHMPALCVSKKSAQAYEALGGKVLACGNGYGDNLANLIKQFPHAKRWLYLRAKIVASDFVSTCQKEGCQIEEAVVYESGCSEEIRDVKVEKEAILIFTSPSSVECFLQSHNLSAENKVVVIGTTTAKALPKGIECFVSKETTIESCIETAQDIHKKGLYEV
jgi:uroporphyrinogen-III synthase